MKERSILSLLIIMIVLVSSRVCVAEGVRAPADVSAGTMIEVSEKSQMLTAKNDMWFKGITKAMEIRSDGSYINMNRRGALPIR